MARGMALGAGEPDAPVVMHPVTLSFEDRAAEAAFRLHWNRQSVTQVRVSIVLGMLLFAGFGLVDLAVIPQHVDVTWPLRFGLVLPLAAVLFGLTFTRVFVPHLQAFVLAMAILAGLVIVAMVAVSAGPGQQFYYAGVLLICVYTATFMRLRFLAAAIDVLIVAAAYAATLIADPSLAAILVVNNVAFVLSIAFVTVSGAYMLERTSRLEFAHRRVIEEQAASLADALANVRELSGLIPICAWCKKIRDDDGYWQRLESYLAPRSRAQFSHGMCPECFAAHAGDAPDAGTEASAEAAGGPAHTL